MTLRTLVLLYLFASCHGDPWYEDADGDGFGDLAAGSGPRPPTAVDRSGDCDDTDPARNPAAAEACDGVDTDCDGILPLPERDADGDGWVACATDLLDWRGDQGVAGGGDCAPADRARFPGAPERCNGVSDACAPVVPAAETDLDGDGFVGCVADGDWLGPAGWSPGDCDDREPLRRPGATEWCDGLDDDCDGALDDAEVDADGDGFVGCTPTAGWFGEAGLAFGDCDDAERRVHPGAAEVCDGVDGDCDGAPGPEELDADGDGVVRCAAVAGAPLVGGDCDDGHPDVYPEAPERCDGLDDDCDAEVPDAEQDGDGDAYVACVLEGDWSGAPEVVGGGDCDDTRAAVSPVAAEALNGADDDCDGSLDPLEADDDGDGFVECVVGPDWSGAAVAGGDCDDTRSEVAPGADEGCDGVDSSCDGVAGVAEADLDGDGAVACDWDAAEWRGAAGVVAGGDCDDRDAAVHVGALEVCNWVDDDCDGALDDDDPTLDPATLRTFYRDVDVDDFGVDTDTTTGCRLPAGYAPAAGDCDDGARGVNPVAVEICDGIDNDCDLTVDDDDPGIDVDLQVDWFLDTDGDQHGDASVAVTSCLPPPVGSWRLSSDDCDDGDAARYGGAPETCNGRDDDCDGHPDIPWAGGGASTLGCDLCTTAADYDVADLHEETWNPCVLDPNAVALCYDGVTRVDTHAVGERLSRVLWRSDATGLRPELFLFTPTGKGTFNTNVLRAAAHAGYRVILMGVPTDVTLADACTGGLGTTCVDHFLDEVQFGTPTSPRIDVSADDALENRLRVLLEHLDAVHPGEGWDAYVSGGAIAWDLVVTSGWSIGAYHAAHQSSVHASAGVVFLSSPNEELAADPLLAPVCRRFAVYHAQEWEEDGYASAAEFEAGFRSMGLGGTTTDLDTDPFPWPLSRTVFTTSTWQYDRSDCSAGKAVAYDGCSDESALVEPYVDLFCHLGEVVPSCP